jgi:hypothetical protein
MQPSTYTSIMQCNLLVMWAACRVELAQHAMRGEVGSSMVMRRTSKRNLRRLLEGGVPVRGLVAQAVVLRCLMRQAVAWLVC